MLQGVEICRREHKGYPGGAIFVHCRGERRPGRVGLCFTSRGRGPIDLARGDLLLAQTAIELIDMNVVGKNADAQGRAIPGVAGFEAHRQEHERQSGIGVARIELIRETTEDFAHARLRADHFLTVIFPAILRRTDLFPDHPGRFARPPRLQFTGIIFERGDLGVQAREGSA